MPGDIDADRSPGFPGWVWAIAWASLLTSVPACGRPGRPEARSGVPAAPAPVAPTHPVSGGPPPPGVPPADQPRTSAEIVARAEPSVALLVGRQGSGTGFLVGRGLLVTNAHVLDGEIVQNVEVRFPSAPEGRRGPYHAELVDQDPARDLSFLAVPTDLPPLELARGHVFRKGEDVLVIGNPGLGPRQVLENAVSRGVLSTRTEIDDRPFDQLSLAVNPGNSGGPVLDAFGRVVGVVTLKGSAGESLTFSVPVEDLIAATDRAAAATARRDGPAATAGVTAVRYGWSAGQTYVYSVRAQFRVVRGVQVLEGSSLYTVKEAGPDRVTIAHRGWLTTRRTGAEDNATTVSGPGEPRAVTLQLDRLGHVLDGHGETPVGLLGDLSTLIIEPLPEHPEPAWEQTQTVAIQTKTVQGGRSASPPGLPSLFADRFRSPLRDRLGPRSGGLPGLRPSPRGPRFGLPRPAPAPAPVEVTTYPAHELTRYRLSRGPGGEPQVVKEYRLQTEARVAGEPRLAMTGDGLITFDPEQGLPREVRFRGQIVENDENITLRVPFELTCRLLAGPERQQAMIVPVLTPLALRPIAPEQLDRDLADLKKPEDGPRRDAAHRLAEGSPIEGRRAEVARALEGLLDDHRGPTNVEAIRALGVWGDARSRGPLIRRLQDPRYGSRPELLEALARLGPDPQAAEAMAGCLGIFGLDAARYLRALGPAAEPAALRVAQGSGPPGARAEACRVLGQIGTPVCVPPLSELAGKRAEGDLVRAAGDGVRQIRERWPDEAALQLQLAALQATDENVARDAAVRLAQAAPREPMQAAVARALVDRLGHIGNDDTQLRVLRALGAWGTVEQRPAVLAKVADKGFSAWREAVPIALKLGPPDEATARILAGRLAEDARLIGEGWKELGPVAEPVVLAAYEQGDGNRKRELCPILAAIGTEKSLPLLEAAALDRSIPFLDGAAREALTAIQARTDPSGLDGLLATIDTKDIFRRGDALRRLLTLRPTAETRPRVARLLESYLDPREAFGQEELYKALGAWGDAQTPARLLALLQDRQNRHWRAAADALVDLRPSAEMLRAVTDRLPDDPNGVGAALRRVPAAAEPVLRDIVAQGNDLRVRAEACRLLGPIGTPASLTALEPLAAQAGLEQVAQAAAEALKAIERRN
jgi:S1-C subfamily serine protease/HEAT repeat protein